MIILKQKLTCLFQLFWKHAFFCLFLFFTACTSKKEYIENPLDGDIYVFEENEIYFPVMVDSVAGETIYCVNSKFKFADALPDLSDLPLNDFDFTFHLIYEKAEIQRLFNEGKIVEVYR